MNIPRSEILGLQRRAAEAERATHKLALELTKHTCPNQIGAGCAQLEWWQPNYGVCHHTAKHQCWLSWAKRENN